MRVFERQEGFVFVFLEVIIGAEVIRVRFYVIGAGHSVRGSGFSVLNDVFEIIRPVGLEAAFETCAVVIGVIGVFFGNVRYFHFAVALGEYIAVNLLVLQSEIVGLYAVKIAIAAVEITGVALV
ncbi:MAG: hypothetical protein ACD_47C00060G0004 [uncultured bacterium]|nr:MAG: hypothetical protein ACD_47C00060G0004 [uncultured bacterium]